MSRRRNNADTTRTASTRARKSIASTQSLSSLVKSICDVLQAHSARIREKDKAARDLEAQADAIDAAVFDLKAVNPNAVATVDARTPAEIIASIDAQGRIVTRAPGRLSALPKADVQAGEDP